MDYKSEIRTFIEGNFVLDDEKAAISDDDNYFQLGFVNSLFAMKLVNFVEQKFDITVDNDELDLANFSTINNVLSLVDNKINK